MTTVGFGSQQLRFQKRNQTWNLMSLSWSSTTIKVWLGNLLSCLTLTIKLEEKIETNILRTFGIPPLHTVTRNTPTRSFNFTHNLGNFENLQTQLRWGWYGKWYSVLLSQLYQVRAQGGIFEASLFGSNRQFQKVCEGEWYSTQFRQREERWGSKEEALFSLEIHLPKTNVKSVCLPFYLTLIWIKREKTNKTFLEIIFIL